MKAKYSPIDETFDAFVIIELGLDDHDFTILGEDEDKVELWDLLSMANGIAPKGWIRVE